MIRTGLKDSEVAASRALSSPVRSNEASVISNQPLVSVIMPSYNHAQYIDQAIKSIIDQEYSNWELLICDDGSIDNTASILDKYNNFDKISIFMNERNRGQGVVLNEGIDKSKGEYICFLASDDIYLPNKLRVQVAKLQECPRDVGFVYSYGARLDDITGEIAPDIRSCPRGNIFTKYARDNFIYPISPMFRRAVFDKERFWDGFVAEGEFLYLRLARHFEVEFIPEVTCAMRAHTYNTGSRIDLMYSENIALCDRLLATADIPLEIAKVIKLRKAWIHRMKGLSYIKITREFKKGRSALLSALKENPRYWFDYKILIAMVIATLSSE